MLVQFTLTFSQEIFMVQAGTILMSDISFTISNRFTKVRYIPIDKYESQHHQQVF